ncbi:MAG: hypothetical protein ACM3UU_08815 [Ignavibacteriales bacterium]
MEEQNNQVVQKNMQPMSLKDWIITFLILLIPFVNLIMPFVWAFGSNVNVSKKNYFRAMLIFMAVFLVLYFILFAAVFSAMISQMGQMRQY